MNSGRANKAALRLILWATAGMVGAFAASYLGYYVGGFIVSYPSVLFAPWALFLVAVLWLSRDPDPLEPADPNSIVAPAHGKVDVIEEAAENEFLKGPCHRLSIRVSLMDPQVQFAPLTGAADHFVHQRHMKEIGRAHV